MKIVNKIKYITLLTIFLSCVQWLPAQEDIKTATIFDFESNEISQEEITIFIDFLTSDLIATKKYKVIDRDRREALLDEMNFSLSGLAEEGSELEIGKLLSANYIMVGSIGKFGGKFVLNVKLIEVETGASIAAVSEKYDNFDTILSDTGRLVNRLVGAEITVLAKDETGKNSDGNVAQLTSLEIFEQTDSLIKDSLSKNFPFIQSRVVNLSPDERLSLFAENEKRPIKGAVLNIFPGFGVGSFSNNNKPSGTTLLILDLIGIAGISAAIYGNFHLQDWKYDNADYWVPNPDGKDDWNHVVGDFIKNGQVISDPVWSLTEGLGWVGIGVFVLSKIIGVVIPAVTSKPYNVNLSEALDME